MNKIVCVGDGYAANHIWPEWPAIIQALYPDCQFENYGAVGAGNEFISSAVIQEYLNNPDSFFLIQWAQPDRFDKLLQDQTWDKIIDSDKVYNFNRVNLKEQCWWLSSASQQAEIEKYHSTYIQPQQAKLRTFNTIYLISRLLLNQGLHFSTQQLNFSENQWLNLTVSPWIRTDMSAYSNLPKFAKIRQQEIQPSPPIHLAYIEEYILPQMPAQPNINRLKELKRRINSNHWQPYDPDRQEIWDNLKNF